MMDDHKNNKTICRSGSDVVTDHDARDVRLQIYISVTLGVGAFLLFCVRTLSCDLVMMR